MSDVSAATGQDSSQLRDETDAALGQLRKAMALWVKYRRAAADGNCKRRLSIDLLGVHPMNRGPLDVRTLGLGITADGLERVTRSSGGAAAVGA